MSDFKFDSEGFLSVASAAEMDADIKTRLQKRIDAAFKRMSEQLERDMLDGLTADEANLGFTTSTINEGSHEGMLEAMKELEKLPPPPKFRARPEWAGHLRKMLSKTPVPDSLVTEIEVKEYVAYRWLIETEDEWIIHTVTGEYIKMPRPDPLSFELDIITGEVVERPAVAAIGDRFEVLNVERRHCIALPDVSAVISIEDKWRPLVKRKRKARGWRKHVRRMKANERRGTWPG